MRFRADRSLRVLSSRDDLVPVLGGSPLRLWRLTPAGGALIARLAAGADVAVGDGSPTGALVDRLLDVGALHPEPSSLPTRFGPRDVTVVIPVRDRAAALARLLGSLASFRDAGAGVVVVDDGSADGPAHRGVAEEHGAGHLRRDRPGGPAAARDAGIAVVTTPIVAVIDSDCEVPDGAGRWWEAPLRLLSDERTAAVAPRVRTPAGPRLLQRYEALRSPLDLGSEPARVSPGTRVSYVPAAALLLRTDAYRAVGGFDRDLHVGEDVDLVWRLAAAGHRVRYEPSVVVEHPARPGVLGWLRQRFVYGTSAAPLEARHPGQVAPARCSPWSAAGWSIAVLGPRRVGPLVGMGVLASSAAILPRRLEGVPALDAWRLAVHGHLGAGRQLARAVLRTWWPVGLVAAVPGSPLRRPARRALAIVAAVAVCDAAIEARRSGSNAGAAMVATIAALAVADDMAYGAGVWWGCLGSRSLRSLLPRFERSAHRL